MVLPNGFFFNNFIIQRAFKAGFVPNNAAVNGKAIDAALNSGNHGPYADKIEAALNAIEQNSPPGDFNPTNAKQKVIDLINTI